MAIRRVPDAWSSTAAYSVGDLVLYNGVVFENTTAVTASTSGNDDPIGNSSWKFDGVHRIVDYYSLQYAVEETLNTSDKIVINQIPQYIQSTETKLAKVLRSPAQVAERVFTVDAESKFRIPSDLLEVIHIRVNEDSRGHSLRDQGSISIQKSDRTTHEEIRQRYINSGAYNPGYEEVEFPVYRLDGEYVRIAPDYDEGTEFLFQYYQEEPELGTIVSDVNADYEPLNSDGQTSTQWIAAGVVTGSGSVDTSGVISFTGLSVGGSPCLLYTSPSPRDRQKSRMPSSA